MITNFQFQQMLARTKTARHASPVEKAVEREADLHDDIIQECRTRGWVCIHSRMDRKSTLNVGIPDFVIATDDGQTLYIEAKSRGGKLTTAQRATLVWLEKNKQITAVIGSMAEFYALVANLKPPMEKP